ncbi:hypothetical protein ACHAWU_005071 [Discostella pseudostelligera]|uniref:Uncharacterized protein n=1 Tax=Discostella pseudostelligera TaxID=259834 RepID=A0ABD3N4H0_9STRA
MKRSSPIDVEAEVEGAAASATADQQRHERDDGANPPLMPTAAQFNNEANDNLDSMNDNVGVDGEQKNGATPLGNLEVIENDEDVPVPFAQQQFAANNNMDSMNDNMGGDDKQKKRAKALGNVEIIDNDEDVPVPFAQQPFAESCDTKKTLTPAVSHCGEDATATGDINSEHEAAFYDGRAYHGNNRRLPKPNDDQLENIQEQVVVQPTPRSLFPSDDSDDDKDAQSNQEYTVLEATLVDDVVYDATPFPVQEDDSPPGYLTIRLPRYALVKYALVGLISVAIVASVVYAVTRDKESSKISQEGNPQSATSNLLWRPKGQPIAIDGGHGYFAFSDSGNVLATGSSSTSETGYVDVYRSVNGLSWQPFGPRITVDISFDDLPPSVDLSADGSIVAFVTPDWYDNLTGHVGVYSLVEGDDSISSRWLQVGQNIKKEFPVEGMGEAISLSGDGKTLAFSSYNATNQADCHVKIFQIEDTGSNWTRLGQNLPCFLSSLNGLALSNDGRTVAIPGADGASVSVYEFDDDISSWVKRGREIVGDAIDNHFLSISADGKTLAVGRTGWNNETYSFYRPGYIRVYKFDEGDASWQQIGDDINGTEIGSAFGSVLCLSKDGMVVAIGDVNAKLGNVAFSGAVRVYRFEGAGSSWVPFGQVITGTAANDFLGSALSLSADGGTIAIGSGSGGLNVKVFSIED